MGAEECSNAYTWHLNVTNFVPFAIECSEFVVGQLERNTNHGN